MSEFSRENNFEPKATESSFLINEFEIEESMIEEDHLAAKNASEAGWQISEEKELSGGSQDVQS